MGMAAVHGMSLEEFLALPEDGLQHELLNGEHIVNPPPSASHEWAFLEFLQLLQQIASTRDDVHTVASRSEVRLNKNTLVQPDVFLFRSETPRRPRRWEEFPIPILVVEILSPSSTKTDRNEKRLAYLNAGVEECWIVDLDAHVVERWRRGFTEADVVAGELTFALSVGLSGSINLPEVFARIER